MNDYLDATDLRSMPRSFAAWRNQCFAQGALPIIVVAGSRGKSTVVRMIDAMLQANGLRSATRTNVGVEIEGVRQRGELTPWSRALDRLASGDLDVAIQEVDWTTIHTLGVSSGHAPVSVVTNVCVNRDACLITDEARRAIAALPALVAATGSTGVMVLNGDDYAVTPEGGASVPSVVFGQTVVSPALRSQLERQGVGMWISGDEIRLGQKGHETGICALAEIPLSLGGVAGFQVQNAMAASAAALCIGLSVDLVRSGLLRFAPPASAMRDTFQSVELAGVTVVIDRPNPSWFFRQVLRCIREAGKGRIIAVAGRLGEIPDADIPEIGRLLGRAASLVVVHSEIDDARRSSALRRGIAMNQVPPPIVHTKSERRAVARALNQARPGDIVIVLADLALPLMRTLTRTPIGMAPGISTRPQISIP